MSASKATPRRAPSSTSAARNSSPRSAVRAAEQASEQAAGGADRGARAQHAGGRIRARVAAGQIAPDLLGEIEDRHALQPDVAGAGQRREEQAFAAEQDVAEPAHHLD